MREIKFRAWDKIKKKMIYNVGSYNLFMFERNYQEDIIFLQFTGLKDKNGKEIFERDIILDNRGIKMEVFFEDGMFKVIFRDGNPKFTAELIDYTTISEEVIGNIYENPELREDKK